MTAQSLRILIVDDNVDVREPLAEWLRRSKEMNTQTAATGGEALQLIKEAGGEYDVVVMDQVLSGMNGIETMRRIKENFSDIPIIMFTGQDPDAGIEALKQGAYRYMLKPFDNEELASLIRSVAERDIALQRTVSLVCRLLNVPVCIAWVLDRTKGRFEISECVGNVDRKYRENIHIDWRSPATQGFLQRAKPIYLRDVRSEIDAPLYKHREEAEARGWVSLLSAPMLSEGDLVGIVDAYTLEPWHFTSADRAILGIVAEQGAMAVRNARLFDRSQALLEITQKITGTFNLDEILGLILRKGLDLVGTDTGWLYLVDQDTKTMHLHSSLGIAEDETGITREIGGGITGLVASNGVPLNIRDTERDDRHLPTKGLIVRSEVAVPLKQEAEVIGVLTAKSPFRDAFTDDDLYFLSSFASQAAVALKNARLFRRERERADAMTLLQKVSANITATLREEETLDSILGGAIQLIGMNTGVIHLVDRIERKALQLHEFPKGFGHPKPRDEGLTWKIVDSGEVVVIPDISQEKRVHPEMSEKGAKSSIGVPLKVREEIIGSLYLSAFEPHTFTEYEEDLLTLLAGQAAAAISNARSFEQARKREKILSHLLHIEQDMTRLALQEPKGTLGQLAHSLCEEIKADCVVIYPYNLDRKGYYDTGNVASYGLWHPLTLTDKRRERGMAAEIRKRGILEIVDVSQGDERFNHPLLQREQIQSFVGVQLCAGDEEVGLLYVNFRQPHTMSKAERAVIQRYAEDAAVVIVERHQATSIQLSSLLRAIANNAKELLEAHLVILYQFRQGRDQEFVTPPVVAGELLDPISMGRRIYDNDMPAVLVRRRESYYADDVHEHELISQVGLKVEARDDQPTRLRFVDREGICSSAGVLLRTEDEILGVMFINYRLPHSFTPELRQQIELFVSQAALAIRSARIFEQTQALLEMSRAIVAAAPEPVHMLDLALEKALELVGFSKGWISLLNDERTKLEVWAARGLSRDKWQLLEQSKGIGWHVAMTGEYTNIPDVSQRRDYVKAFDDTKSELCVPLKYHDQVLGVLNVESAYKAAFSGRDEELLIALANGATVALKNARLLQQEIQRADALGLLQSVSARINTSLDVHETLKFILEGAKRLTNMDSGVAYLFNEAEKIAHSLETPEGFGHPHPRLSRKTGMTRSIIDSGQLIAVPDVEKDHRVSRVMLEKGIKSQVGVPIKGKERVVGVFYLNATEPRRFADNELSLLSTLADHAAMAIRNARSVQQLRENVEQLVQLQKVTAAISVGPPEVGRVVDQITFGISKVFDGISCGIREYDSRADRFTPLKGTGLLHASIEYSPRLGGTTRHVINLKEPLFIEDAAVRSPGQPLVRRELREKGVKSAACLPLISGENVKGTLYVVWEVPRRFPKSDKLLLELFADQAAIAIENARLYEQRVGDIAALQEINAAITTGSWKDISMLIKKQAEELTEAKHSELWLVARGLLVPGRMFGEKGMDTDMLDAIPIDESSLNGWVALKGEPYLCTDSKSDSHFELWQPGFRSSIAVPLKFEERLIGTLSVESDSPRAFSKRQQELLEALADQAAIAISNTQRVHELKMLGEISGVFALGSITSHEE